MLINGSRGLSMYFLSFFATRRMLILSRVNIEHQMYDRPENIIDGKGQDSEGSSTGSMTKAAGDLGDGKAGDLA